MTGMPISSVSMTLDIHSVSSRQDWRFFLDLPRQLYRDHPDYVQPLRAVVRQRLQRADLTLLVAVRDGTPVGRISVMRDRLHDEHKAENIAFCGFFESVDDREVAFALFDAASQCAREMGADILRGPRGLTRIDETGILVEGRARAPFLAGHHPAFYPGFFEEAGFARHHDVLAYDISIVDEEGAQRPLPEKLQERAAAVDIDGLQIASCSYRNLWEDLGTAHTVMVEGFRDVPENTPIPKGQFVAMGAGLLGFTNRHMLQLATVHGEPAAFALCFPELNEALIYARGRVFPFGIGRFGVGLRRIRTASFKLLGVCPEYRGTGLHAKVIAHAIDGVKRAGYHRLEASLIDERNGPMRHIVESSGMDIYRRYRVYERPV